MCKDVLSGCSGGPSRPLLAVWAVEGWELSLSLVMLSSLAGRFHPWMAHLQYLVCAWGQRPSPWPQVGATWKDYCSPRVPCEISGGPMAPASLCPFPLPSSAAMTSVWVNPMLVSEGCHNKVPHMGWLIATVTYSLSVLDLEGPCSFWRLQGRLSPRAFLLGSGVAIDPWHSGLQLCHLGLFCWLSRGFTSSSLCISLSLYLFSLSFGLGPFLMTSS